LDTGSAELDGIIERLVEALEAGDVLAIERACREHPAHAGAIRDAARAVQALRQFAGGDPAPETVAAPRPATIGPYRLGRELGRGGSGTVFLAEDTRLGRSVAVKVLRTDSTPQARERFRREAQALARLRHPNVAAVHDVGETEQGLPWLTMDFVDGESLDAVLWRLAARDPASLTGLDLVPGEARRGVSWVVAVVRLVTDVAHGLAAAHAEGIVHRDVKPANILVERGGRPYLADFGLAHWAEAAAVTRTGTAPGTPLTMAPEQVSRDRGVVGPRSDVWALGATLYHALTLRTPFAGDDATVEQLYQRILHAEPLSPRRLNATIPRDLETIVLTAMEKDPQRRYATAAEMAADLEALLALRPIVARPPSVTARAAKWVRRNPVVAATLAAAVLTAFAPWAWRIGEARREGFASLERFEQDRGRLAAMDEDLRPRLAALGTLATPDDRGRTATLERTRDDLLLDMERTLMRACEALESALSATWFLGGLNDGLRRRLVDGLVQRAGLAGARGSTVDAERLLEHARDVAGREWEDWYRGRVTLACATSGTVAHLFAYRPYEEQRRDVIPRLVPVPISTTDGLLLTSRAPGFAWGDLCLEVTAVAPGSPAERGGLKPGDLIYDIGGRPVRDEGLYVVAVEPGGNADTAGARPFDRVLSVRGKPMRGLWSWERVPSGHDEALIADAGRVVVDVVVEGAEGEVRVVMGEETFPVPDAVDASTVTALLPTRTRLMRCGTSDAATIEDAVDLSVGEIGDLLEQASPCRQAVGCLRGGEAAMLEWPLGVPFGAAVEATAYPLVASPANRFPPATDAVLRLEPGSYLALLQAEGHVAVRVPFVVQAQRELSLAVELPTVGAVPPGFVFVPGGECVLQGEPDVTVPLPRRTEHVDGFFISRREVTYAEWLAFANEVAPPDQGLVLAAANGDKLPDMVAVPIPLTIWGTPWVEPRAGCTWAPCRHSEPGTAVVGIRGSSHVDLFLGWLNQRARGTGWRYDVPTQEQWEKAARGVDGRAYPWGDRFDFTLCNSLFARDKEQAAWLVQEPPGRFPTDESPYGILDMAGGAVEFNAGVVDETIGWTDVLRGGSWVMANPVYFRAASRVPSRSDVPERGLRLAAVRVEE